MGIAERKEREKEQRRKAILEAAENIFFKKGIDLSTMDEVAEEAELSKGTLYLYFKSKEDIQFAIFQRGAEILVSMFNSAISTKNTGLENLLSLGRTFIEFSGKYHDYFTLFIAIQSSKMHTLNVEPGALEYYFRFQSPLTLVQSCVEQGIADGSIRSDLHAASLGATLWSQMLGVMTVIHNHDYLFEILGISLEVILEAHFDVAENWIVPR